MAKPPIATDNMGEQGQELQPIAVVPHDVLPGIAKTGDMIDGTGEFKNLTPISHTLVKDTLKKSNNPLVPALRGITFEVRKLKLKFFLEAD